jgi:hypothetical protein
MNLFYLSANLLFFAAFVVHSFVGDKEIREIEPYENSSERKREIWTMIRCGWHWISTDLEFFTLALTLVNFTNFFTVEDEIVRLIIVYLLCYTIIWLAVISFSKAFSKNYLKLGQWLLFIFIALLLYLGMNYETY